MIRSTCLGLYRANFYVEMTCGFHRAERPIRARWRGHPPSPPARRSHRHLCHRQSFSTHRSFRRQHPCADERLRRQDIDLAPPLRKFSPTRMSIGVIGERCSSSIRLGESSCGTERGAVVRSSKNGFGRASPRIDQPAAFVERQAKTQSDGGAAFDGSGPMAECS